MSVLNEGARRGEKNETNGMWQADNKSVIFCTYESETLKFC